VNNNINKNPYTVDRKQIWLFSPKKRFFPNSARKTFKTFWLNNIFKKKGIFFQENIQP